VSRLSAGAGLDELVFAFDREDAAAAAERALRTNGEWRCVGGISRSCGCRRSLNIKWPSSSFETRALQPSPLKLKLKILCACTLFMSAGEDGYLLTCEASVE
jgi:hypothetical protein